MAELTAEQMSRLDELAAEGKGRRVIAKELGVSAWAVRKHLEANPPAATPEPAPEPEPTPEPEPVNSTREAWLEAAVAEMRPWLAEAGAPLPKRILVSIGFPSRNGLASRNQRIGECWLGTSQGGVPHVFVTPLEGDPLRVLDILLHELVHAAGISGHGKDFKRVAVALGLEGKMTATVAGEELRERLAEMAERLGPYPHRKLEADSLQMKKQGTRMHKAACSECGCVIRMTRKWIESVGAPLCACGAGQMEVEGA